MWKMYIVQADLCEGIRKKGNSWPSFRYASTASHQRTRATQFYSIAWNNICFNIMFMQTKR